MRWHLARNRLLHYWVRYFSWNICLEFGSLMTFAGSVNASITSFSRTIDDYNKLAKQELVPEKQTKAYERVKTFKSELGDYRDRLDRIKQDATEKVCTCEACSRNTAQRPFIALQVLQSIKRIQLT
jgi:hypothetical protein